MFFQRLDANDERFKGKCLTVNAHIIRNFGSICNFLAHHVRTLELSLSLLLLSYPRIKRNGAPCLAPPILPWTRSAQQSKKPLGELNHGKHARGWFILCWAWIIDESAANSHSATGIFFAVTSHQWYQWSEPPSSRIPSDFKSDVAVSLFPSSC